MSQDDPGGVPTEQGQGDGAGSAGTDLTSDGKDSDRRKFRRRRWKLLSSWVLIVLACLLAVVSVLVVWTKNELLDTNTFVATVTPLGQNPAIQSAVAARVSNQLVSQSDLQQRVKNALPPKAGFLAAPLATQVRSLTNQLTLKLVQSSAFQKLWVASVRRSHQQLTALLTGQKQGSVSSSNGEVTVDLAQVETRVRKELDARGITVFNKVPKSRAPTLVLFRSTQLLKIQALVRFLDKLAVFLPILTLLCFAGGIALATDRRKGLVRAAGGLALSMAVLLIGASVARNQFLGSLLPTQSKDAAAAAIDTVSAILVDAIRTILVVAALVTLGAVIAGNSALRRWMARATSSMAGGPVHGFVVRHRGAIQWGVLALGLFVLVVWDRPTTLVAIVVILMTLAVIGLIGLFAGIGSHGEVGPGGETGAGSDPMLSGGSIGR